MFYHVLFFKVGFNTSHTCILIFFSLIGLITSFQNSAINHFDVTWLQWFSDIDISLFYSEG